MPKLSLSEIQKVARLARIELASEELDRMTLEVGSILEFVDSLQAIKTEGVKPTSQVTGLKDVWREDVVQDCEIPREELLSQSPATQDGYVKVKKVL
ncbi:Asp-tRNA(Asn)/Glu-tRNA(Gln) amidotransferase subunit GatC [Candidatus Saccharibacteria bacterium]|nr:Asp-tRNA(Asn)/Glu-tRNA(Gln) amidotransferase subunit GatC [Candidatus Saccharibacteria bacterium]